MDDMILSVEEYDDEEDIFFESKPTKIQKEENLSDSSIEEGEIVTTDSNSDSDSGEVSRTDCATNHENDVLKSNFKCGITYECITEHERPRYDIYIGGETKLHQRSFWYNPYETDRRLTAVDMLKKYENYIRQDKMMYSRLSKLQNKCLGCW